MQHLLEIFQTSVRCFPSRIAVEEPTSGHLTYQMLAEKTNQLSKALAHRGICKGMVVGILQPKSIESVVSILSILSIDAAYVPVDFQAPTARNSYIFNDCRVDAILVSKDSLAEIIDGYPAEFIIHDIPGFSMQIVIPKYTNIQDEDGPTLPSDLAYILYTSGSTGKPKGVMITHQNALPFIEWSHNIFAISCNDVLTSIAPFHFDLSIFDIYVSILSGAKLVLINQQTSKNPRLVSQLIQDYNVTVIYATPTFLKLILKYGKPGRFDHTSMRLVIFAGEVFPIVDLRKMKRLWSNALFYNLYGPTETNVVTFHEIPTHIPEHQLTPYPIGRSCSFTTCKIWNEGVQEPVANMRGELIVRGENLALGYLNLPVKTRASFFETDNERWYKTGDLVEVNDKLEFVFIGRLDRMVKRNGYRIELAEIESALSAHPDIDENGVISSKNENGELIIIAYIRTQDLDIELTDFQLKQFCVSKLLKYMIPDKFVRLVHMPKTSSHKIDYQKLQQL